MTDQVWVNELFIDNQRRSTKTFSVDLPTASSGLTAALSILSGPASVNGNVITLTGVGKVTVRASAPSTTTFNALTSEYTFWVADEIVRLYKRVGSNTAPYNEIDLPGDNYLYARLSSGLGSVPPGLNWIGTSKGLKFWGTPSSVSEPILATFEGPYPANFRSNRTYGGWPDEPTDCDAPSGASAGSIGVFNFYVLFTITELPSSSYNTGEILYYLTQYPWVVAQRWAWRRSGRYINSVAIQKIPWTSSDVDDQATGNNQEAIGVPLVYEGQTSQGVLAPAFTKADMMANDWSMANVVNLNFGSYNPGHLNDRILLTNLATEQYIIPETSSDYAQFQGIKLDPSAPFAFKTSVEISSGDFIWGEFFVPDAVKSYNILFYTTNNDNITTTQICRLGIKNFEQVFQSGYQNYRSAGNHSYSFQSDPNQSITSEVIPIDGKHVIFNIEPISATFPVDGRVKAYLMVSV